MAWAQCLVCGRPLDYEVEIDETNAPSEGPDFCSDECFEEYTDEACAARAREAFMLDVVQRYGAHMIGRLI